MNTNETVREDIEVGVDAITLDIPVRVVMTSINNAPFDFTTSIDEVGQIILTPLTKDVEFVSANTDDNVQYDIPVREQETVLHTDDNLTTKETSILITASMLAENDSHRVSADIDEIGQVVIYPMAKENVFVTATLNDSLNLVTEGMQMHEYCDDYKIINPGDGWYVKQEGKGLIGQGFTSLNAAKIFVCENEISRLSKLTEEVEEPTEETSEEKSDAETTDEPKQVTPEVTVEVIEESIVEPQKVVEFTDEEVIRTVEELTNSFTDVEGKLKCDTIAEGKVCSDLLRQHYDTVNIEFERNYIVVTYRKNLDVISEELDDTSRLNIINEFMRGDIALFSDTGTPDASFTHLTELDSNGYEYYYDEETHSIISYPARGE